MLTFQSFKLSKSLANGLVELGFTQPTPIQEKSFSVIRSGKNVVGIAQTGTGKTLAYLLPLLQDLRFSDQRHPRILILVPTRELVLQVVEQVEQIAKYMSVRVLGVYGGTNINTQKLAVAHGTDILVATPGRLYDIALTRALSLKSVNKLVIDEVDVMLDLGFRFQLTNIFELLPQRRQNLMFSATMTEEIDALIDDFFIAPTKISIAVSGTPLENIAQQAYAVPNFYTKANLLTHLLQDTERFNKILVFMPSKKSADRLYELLVEQFGAEVGVIHANKSQNFRINAIQDFEEGNSRILVATDVMARGLDLDSITHVISFNTPQYPENYMHRIGRTGRAEQEGQSLLLFTEKEQPAKEAIEALMDYKIPLIALPGEVAISSELTPEERNKNVKHKSDARNAGKSDRGPGFHEKKAKNKKTNLGGKYRRELAKKYKKPKTRGDKRQNRKRKKR